MSLTRCEKRAFCAIFNIKVIFLPRQARDKHRESTQKKPVLSKDVGRDDHVGRAQIKIRFKTNHGYEVDHADSGVAELSSFRPVEDKNAKGWPLFYKGRGSSRHQEGSIFLEFSQHAFVPRSTWLKDPSRAHQIRLHVFSAQDLPVEDSDGVNEVFLRASMGRVHGR
jgi:nitrate reductase alpha subunit